MLNLYQKGIFGHVFQSDGQDFYYDVNTNQILEIEPELAAVLPLFGTKSQEEILHDLANTWPQKVIQEAYELICSAQKEEGLFLVKRPILEPPEINQRVSGECDANLQHLVLTITEQCNMRCRYCLHGAGLNWVRSHGEKTMTLTDAQNSLQYFLDRVEANHIPMISFYGGEALMELELIEKVIQEGRKHPKGKDAMFIIDTNGLLLSGKATDLVIREKVYLQVSIDGPDLWHDQNRIDVNGKGTLSRILKNLERLLELDPFAANRLSFITTLAPPVDLFEIADFFASFPPFVKRGIKSQPRIKVNFANLNGQPWTATEQDYQALENQVNQAREIYLAAVENETRDALSPVIRELFEPDLVKLHHRSRGRLSDRYTPGGNCQPGKRKLHVTVDGKFHPCEQTGKELELGSIKTGIEATRVLNLQEKFHDGVKEKCGNCWALRMCGVCFALQAEYGMARSDGLAVPENICQSICQDRENCLKMLGRILQLPEGNRAFLDEWVIS